MRRLELGAQTRVDPGRRAAGTAMSGRQCVLGNLASAAMRVATGTGAGMPHSAALLYRYRCRYGYMIVVVVVFARARARKRWAERVRRGDGGLSLGPGARGECLGARSAAGQRR